MLRMSVVLAFIYFYLIDFIPSFLMSLSENELIGIPIYSLSSVQPFVCVYLACPVLLVVSRQLHVRIRVWFNVVLPSRYPDLSRKCSSLQAESVQNSGLLFYFSFIIILILLEFSVQGHLKCDVFGVNFSSMYRICSYRFKTNKVHLCLIAFQ